MIEIQFDTNKINLGDLGILALFQIKKKKNIRYFFDIAGHRIYFECYTCFILPAGGSRRQRVQGPHSDPKQS